MKRAFICGFFNYPRGSAPANYVQYLSLLLREVGYCPVVVSNVNKGEVQNNRSGIEIREINLSKNRIIHYMQYNYGLGIVIHKMLKKEKLTEQDIIISYSMDVGINCAILNLSKTVHARCYGIITEWFQKDQFKHGKFDKLYLQYVISRSYLLKKFDGIFPISTAIEKQYSNNNTLVLPILADPSEYAYVAKDWSGKRKFVYPASGKIKDAIDSVIKSICGLSDEEIEKCEFHFLGVSKELFWKYATGNVRKYIGKNIILHGWLTYDELIFLYQKTHYLLLFRENTVLTQSNFPSKVPECLCYGIIPIASMVGDYTRFYLDASNSIRVSGCEVEQCINAVRSAITMDTKKARNMEKSARNTAVTLFAYENWIERMSEFLLK